MLDFSADGMTIGLILLAALLHASWNALIKTGGDRLVASISAASVLAKVYRDRLMLSMHDLYPGYGFDRHKGYPTAFHLDRLKTLGPCPIHRKSFAPVRNLLGSDLQPGNSNN